MLVYAACIYCFIVVVVLVTAIRVCRTIYIVCLNTLFKLCNTTCVVPHTEALSESDSSDDEPETDSSQEDYISENGVQDDEIVSHESMHEVIRPTCERFPVVLRPCAYTCNED
jgi:hypothetical protein